MTSRPSRFMWLVVLLASGFSLLAALDSGRTDSSRLWWLDPLLLGVFVVGLWRVGRGGQRAVVSGWRAAALFIGCSWLTGMVYELSLRTGPTGFGGMHPDTATSFLLAQGYYVPFAVGGWWLARRYAYSLPDVFWAGALSSLYEVITSGGPRLLADPALLPLLPLILGYYLTAYGLILALPLLALDERSLWREGARPVGRWRRAAAGVGLGLVCWVVFTAWAALVGA